MSYHLCAKNIILKERLSAPAFDWLLEEIKSKFDQSIVQPGEMVGSVAA
jgi:DNA-directed RNA polymerase II subunit RPB1